MKTMMATKSMKAKTPTLAALVAFAVAGSGCATTWLVTHATDSTRLWDESVREQVVPRPGVEERLTVTMPLAPQLAPAPATATANGQSGAQAAAATPRAELPFALRCVSEQRASDDVYHSAFRYGKRWKTGTAVMFLAEGAAATALLLAGKRESAEPIYGAFFALDAIGTAALFFAPRREVYRKDARATTTQVRSDCPEGLVLVIGGDSFPVDAAGRIGEVGEVALDDWMAAPSGPLLLQFAQQTIDLRIGAAEQCAWSRYRARGAASTCSASPGMTALPRDAQGSIVVPVGTLTVAAAR
ncbi:MAG: hypothetical protein ACTHU0_29675 [Kofleriaceae bacterium]